MPATGRTTPERSTGGHRVAKAILISLAIIAGIGIAVFLFFLIYYTWQFRFGDAEDAARLAGRFERDAFTLATTGQKKQTTTDLDIRTFIRPHNPIEGTPGSNIIILAFIDFECPFCRESYPNFSAMMQTYQPAVHVIFKHLPLTAIHPHAMDAALASACAQAQGAFWDYHNLLFQDEVLDRDALVDYARQLRLNMNTFETCLNTEQFRSNIEQDMLDAVELGVRGTPTYFINQDILEGVVSSRTWNETILNRL